LKDPFSRDNILRLIRFDWASYTFSDNRLRWTGDPTVLIRAANLIHNLLNRYAKDRTSLTQQHSIVYPSNSPLITKYIPPSS
jgi:hypothetical protein